LADAGSRPGNCSGMEEATGAPSSFADWDPSRLRASGRDGGAVMTRPPSPLTMLLSRHTRRREVITLVCGAVTTWPFAARAQQPPIGYLTAANQSTAEIALSGFHQGLRETGFVEGRNVRIEYRWADGQYDRMPALAAELARLRVDVIYSGGPPSTRAAIAA